MKNLDPVLKLKINTARRLSVKKLCTPDTTRILKYADTLLKAELKNYISRIKYSARDTGGGAVHIEAGGSHYSRFQ